MKKLQHNEISKDTKVSLRKRVITGFIFAAVAAPCVIIGNWLFFGFIVLLTGLAGYELVHITKLKGKLRYVVYVITITSMLLMTNYIFFRNNWPSIKAGQQISAWDFVSNGFINIELSSMIIIFVAIIFFILSFSTEQMTISYVCYFVTMIIICSLGIQSFLYLRFSPFPAWQIADPSYYWRESFPYLESLLLVLYLAIGVMMNDIGAYFVGILFGKHKMNPRISPKKTWEGFIGGVVISAVASVGFALAMTLTGRPLLPGFTMNNFYWVVLISIVMPLAGDIGDFVFSALKRNEGVKDFSNLLPGHGGFLDRIDSLLFAGGSIAVMIAFVDFITGVF